jgi:1-acyl-sn-glycerol-3-phosphate acyltransferase
MGRDLLLGCPRSFRDDCALAVRLLPRHPVVDGVEHAPAAGSFVLIANHYERRDLWIGWSSALLCDALWSIRPDLTCHFVTTDRAVMGGATVPGTRPLFIRVARVWDFIPVTPPEARDAAQEDARRALRRCLRKVLPADGRSACLVIFPEGMRGSTRGLREPPPGNGRSLLALAATGVPILPAAVWEEPDGALHARYGPLWRLDATGAPPHALDRWAAHEAMARIAALLPAGLRGAYGPAAPSE